MADNRLTIDDASLFDDPAARQVEFRGDVDGECHDFAVQYSVLEALTGSPPAQPVAAFRSVADSIATAALVALARSDGSGRIVVSENDLDQTASTAPGPHAGPEADGLVRDGGVEAEAHPS